MTRRKRYSAEFKREAIRRANEEGVTDALVAEELGIDAESASWRGVFGIGHITVLIRTRRPYQVHYCPTRNSSMTRPDGRIARPINSLSESDISTM